MNGIDPKTLKAGDKLWFVSSMRNTAPGWVTITKVGRTWLTLSNGHRADRKNLYVEGHGYSPPGALFPDKRAHDAFLRDQAAWWALRRAIDNRFAPPPGVTAEGIQRCAELIGLPLEIKTT